MKGFGIEDEVDNEATGKNTDSIKKSRAIRAEFLQKYGFIPESILKRDSHDKAIDLLVEEHGRDYGTSGQIFVDGRAKTMSQAEREIYGVSGTGARTTGLSRFPQNIGRIIIDFYCPEKGLVYDPFAGHNSRMQLVFESGRNYLGVDLSETFMKANYKVKNLLLEKKGRALVDTYGSRILLLNGSSASVPQIESNYADFTITSPPYYDVEYYGDEPEQLGKNKTYEDFLSAIKLHIEENFRILKPDSYCAWFINDFYRKGVFCSYHSDLINIFKEVGFIHKNTYIVDLGPAIGAAFVQQIIRTKQFPKRHEYVILFKKPVVKEVIGV
jgi:DNA modification methylase